MDILSYVDTVSRFIESLPSQSSARTIKAIELLRTYGYLLTMPHSRSMGQGLFELRVRGEQEIRIFYCFYNQKAVLLHGFIKKTPKTPEHEISIARKRLNSLTTI